MSKDLSWRVVGKESSGTFIRTSLRQIELSLLRFASLRLVQARWWDGVERVPRPDREQIYPGSHRGYWIHSAVSQNFFVEVTELSRESKVAFVYARGVEPVSGLLVEFFSVRFNCLLAE